MDDMPPFDWPNRDPFGPPPGRMPMRDHEEFHNKERRPRDPVISIDYGHKSTKGDEDSAKPKEDKVSPDAGPSGNSPSK